jgi:hypothetical protein
LTRPETVAAVTARYEERLAVLRRRIGLLQNQLSQLRRRPPASADDVARAITQLRDECPTFGTAAPGGGAAYYLSTVVDAECGECGHPGPPHHHAGCGRA